MGQTAVSYTYDNANRLTQITQSSSTTGFAYDNANRRTSLTLPNGVTLSYTYDNASRLTGMNYQFGPVLLGDLSYTYDNANRRTVVGGSFARSGLPAAILSGTYDVANQLTNWNGTTLTYDANGNLTNDGTSSYSWNARNQLTAMGSSSFQYDGLGRRTQNASGIQFLYDAANPVQEISGTTPLSNRITGHVDEFFSLTDTSGSYFPLTDALGSVMGLTDSGGSIATQYTYEPFGNTLQSGAPNSNTAQYTGRENDGNGLYYYRARYYSPQFGRFVSQDPIGFGGGVNQYIYVIDNPVAYIDPSGLDLTITVYSGIRGNPAGHIAIAVNGGTPQGFDPKPGWDLLTPFFPVPGVIGEPIGYPDRTPIQTITIPTTAAQDLAVQNYIDSWARNPGKYDLAGRNCTFFVYQALAVAGISVNGPRNVINNITVYPGDLAEAINHIVNPQPRAGVTPVIPNPVIIQGVPVQF